MFSSSLEYNKTMQGSILRRNYYLMRAHSREQLRKDENRDREIYSETVRVVDEMITSIKGFLFKTTLLRQDLQQASEAEQSQEGQEYENLASKLKQLQKQIPLTFFSYCPLDSKMLGVFVLRICKQISYCANNLPYLYPIVKEIENLFQEQKNSQGENIGLVYFVTVKKIISETNKYLKKIKSTKVHQGQEKEKSHIFQVEHQEASSTTNQVGAAFNHIYKDLDLDPQSALTINSHNQQERADFDSLCSLQLKRNRNSKKEAMLYMLAYQRYIVKRQRQDIKKKTFSNTSQMNFINSRGRQQLKSVSIKYNNVLPSIHSQEKPSKLTEWKRYRLQKERQLKVGRNKNGLNNRVELRLRL